MKIIVIVTIMLVACYQSADAQIFLQYKYDKAKEALEQGNYEKAIEGLTELLTSATDQRLRAICFSGRSSANAWLQRDKQAVTDLDSAIAIDSTNIEWYCHRGRYKFRSDDYDGADRDLKKFVDRNPAGANAIAAYEILWTISNKNGRFKEGVSYASALIALEPADATLYFNRGYGKMRLEDFEGAIADCDSAIRLNPKYASAYVNRAMAKFNVLQRRDPESTLTNEQMSDGCKDLRKALEFGNAAAERLLMEHCR